MESRSPHVVHLIATNFFGGPEKQILEHCIRLKDSGFAAEVISYLEYGRRNEFLERAASAGLPARGVPMYGPLDMHALVRLYRILKSLRPCIVCTHGYKATIMAWLAASRLRLPTLAFSRGYTAETWRVALYETLERRILPWVHGVVFVSHGQRKRLENLGVKVRRSWVVHNAVSVNGFPNTPTSVLRPLVCERLGVDPEAKLVVSAGRLSPEKGHQYLIRAARDVLQSEPKTTFVFCGSGPCLENLKRLARHLDVASHCLFTGFRHDLPEIFRVMDVFALPSLTEGLPNVVLEAFASAKPVVATAVGGVPELIEPDRTGILVPPEKPEALAEAILSILRDKDKATLIGQNAYHAAASKFTFEAQTRQLLNIYSDLMRSPRV